MSNKKDQLYENARASALQYKIAQIDFAAMLQQSIEEADELAKTLCIDQKLNRGFVTAEFAKMKSQVINQFNAEVALNLPDARNKADEAAKKQYRAVCALSQDGELFAELRARLPETILDTSEYPELAEYAERLMQLHADGTEEAIIIAKQFTRTISDFLRQGYEIELRFIFSCAFIGEPEVKALVELYLSEVPELHLAA